MRPMHRVMLAQTIAGGCGFVLPFAQSDNWDCGTSVDTAGIRFSGATAWTFPGNANLVSSALVAGELEIVTSSNGGPYNPIGPYQPLPVGNWVYETSVRMAKHNAIEEKVGFYLAESATGRSLVFGAGYGNGFVLVAAMAILTSTPAYLTEDTIGSWTTDYEADLRLSRTGATLLYEYKLPGGGWTTLISHAQTVPFTTAPDRIGVAKVNSVANIGNNAGYFGPFTRTA
jgi:hypothetical protein